MGKSFGENINLVKFKENLLEFNYSRDKQTIKNIATGDTVCPIKNDLIKILKTCSANSSNYLFESSHADSIYKYASEYKSLRGKAGKSIKPKIFNALRKMNIDFDGNPLRVDYISNGSISLGSDTSNKPEAWIVEVSKNYKELKNKKNSELNKVIF